MAKQEFITKISGKEKKEITYRIDADFAPTDINDICIEFIENYCVAKKETGWLVDTVSKSIVDKTGKKRDYPFVSIRADFVKKFFPEIVKGTSKGETIKERILRKYGK